MATVSKTALALLAAIVTSTQSEAGYQFVSIKDAAPLVKAGYVEQNPALSNEAGDLATRATESGVSQVQAPGADGSDVDSVNTSNVTTGTVASPVFLVVGDVPMPAATRGGRSGGAYPFDKLEPKQSFFVPATDAKPNPAKSMASTVSSANERFSEVVEGETRRNRKGDEVPATRQTREFAVRPVADGAPWGEQYAGVKGAGVWRIL